MKEIKEEVKSYITKYEAVDGTIFSDKAECQKYENSALAVLNSKYKKLVIKSISEYNLFNTGTDEDLLDVVKINNDSDKNVILQMWALYNSYQAKDTKVMLEKEAICDKAMIEDDVILIYRSYDGDCFGFSSTFKDRINNIINNVKPDVCV